MLQVVLETRRLMFLAISVYFELKLRFPADGRTVAIGSSGMSPNAVVGAS